MSSGLDVVFGGGSIWASAQAEVREEVDEKESSKRSKDKRPRRGKAEAKSLSTAFTCWRVTPETWVESD